MNTIKKKHGGSHLKFFEVHEWKDADRIDRLYMYMLEAGRWELPAAEIEYLENLTKAWAIMQEEDSHRGRAKKIIETLDVVDRTAYRMMGDATRLFGDMLQVDYDLELRLAMSRQQSISKKAENEGDYKTASTALAKAIEIAREIDQRKPAKERKYQPLQLTTNTAVLNQLAEDTAFEDVE